jgi:hypothetical protein
MYRRHLAPFAARLFALAQTAAILRDPPQCYVGHLMRIGDATLTFPVRPDSAPGLSERKVGPPRLSYRCATEADEAF